MPPQVYFSKEWAALTEASVRNFLAEALSMLPLPGLLRKFEGQQQLQQRISELEAEVKSAVVASMPVRLRAAAGWRPAVRQHVREHLDPLAMSRRHRLSGSSWWVLRRSHCAQVVQRHRPHVVQTRHRRLNLGHCRQ